MANNNKCFRFNNKPINNNKSNNNNIPINNKDTIIKLFNSSFNSKNKFLLLIINWQVLSNIHKSLF